MTRPSRTLAKIQCLLRGRNGCAGTCDDSMGAETISRLRQRTIEDMNARKLGAHTQRGHIYSTPDDDVAEEWGHGL